MRLAVIPARGGSKRIPGKNIRSFAGRPIITYSIAAAKASGCFDRIFVSTDDEAIAGVAQDAGAEVPFLRPPTLADDHTGTASVVRHAISWAQTAGLEFAQTCCLYATAPFVTADSLRRGLTQLERSGSSYAFSVTSFAFPIQRAVRILPNGRVAAAHPENASMRSQDLEEMFHDAGQFYWGRTDAWERDVPLFSEASTPVVLPRHLVQDIDTPEDWRRAELMFEALRLAGELAR